MCDEKGWGGGFNENQLMPKNSTDTPQLQICKPLEVHYFIHLFSQLHQYSASLYCNWLMDISRILMLEKACASS